MNNSMFWVGIIGVIAGIIFSFRNFNKSLAVYSLLDSKGNNGNFYRKEGHYYYNYAANWFIFTTIAIVVSTIGYLTKNG